MRRGCGHYEPRREAAFEVTMATARPIDSAYIFPHMLDPSELSLSPRTDNMYVLLIHVSYTSG